MKTLSKIKLFSTLSLPLVVGGGLTALALSSCTPNGNELKINWRTEDYEGVVNTTMWNREYIWIEGEELLPKGKWAVSNKLDALPPGISLDTASGHLSGTPTSDGIFHVIFSYIAKGYKTCYSKPIEFNIEKYGTKKVPVTWNSNISVDFNTNYQGAVGTSTVSGGQWVMREGWRLPSGLTLNSNTGMLSGKVSDSSETKQWNVSFEYIVGGYEKNVSDIYHLSIYHVHTLSFNQMSQTNGQYTTTFDNLVVEMRDFVATNVGTITKFLNWLSAWGYNSMAAYLTPEQGTSTDSGGSSFQIKGVYRNQTNSKLSMLAAGGFFENLNDYGDTFKSESCV